MMRLALIALLLLPGLAAAAPVQAPLAMLCPIPGPSGEPLVCLPPDGPAATAILVGAVAVAGALLVLPPLILWWAWLRWLPIMGGFTRLRQDRLLDHPVRADLFARIEERPGIHYLALVEASGKAKGAVSHHLATLSRAGIITAIRQRGFSSYFVRGAIDAPVMHGLAAVKAPAAARALRDIAAEPGRPAREVARRVGLHESTLRHHVRRFSQAGMVAQEGGLQLTELGARVVAHIPDDFGMPQHPPGAA